MSEHSSLLSFPAIKEEILNKWYLGLDQYIGLFLIPAAHYIGLI